MTKQLSLTVTASAISVLFGTAASGAYYPGKMDPGGTGTVPGWNGTAIFQIDSSCVPAGFTGWMATNQNPGVCSGCGNASVFSANVLLYSKSPSTPPGPVLDSFTLGTSNTHGLPNPPTFDIVGVYDLNGQLDGVDTFAMGPVSGSSTYSADNFWLQFVSGFCNPDIASCPALGPDASGYLFYQPGGEGNILTGNVANVTFGPSCDNNPVGCRVVPEPGTLGLIAGALGAGWLIRRRKAKTRAESS
jgi:hypothetical protein